MSEFALRFVLANLAIGAAVLVVLALRMPMRAMFGARLTYALWLLVPLAGLASLLPPRVEQIVNIVRATPEMRGEWAGPVPWEPMLVMPGQDGPAPETSAIAPPQLAGTMSIARESSGFEMPSPIVLALIAWLVGVIGMAAWQLRRQSRFVSDAKAGFAGPAVVGVIHPRIVTPSDFETTFDPSEREMILTHERIHIEGNDARINALAALAGCICWFNPLVHLGAYFMRIDQELACDASVVIRHPEAKSLYASALLKAQLARAPLPLGCHWPSRSEHPLLQRVEMLGRAEPARGRRIAGVALLGLLAAASGVAAWAALPPERRVVERNIMDAPQMGDVSPTQDAPAPQDAHVQESLRIVALRHALLEIRTATGEKMVHRNFEPGESYVPRIGNGWTVSAEDGSAFEWRAGDKSLGLLAPSGAANLVPVDSAGLQPIKLQVTPQDANPANQQQVRYSTFVVSADKVTVETGRSIYEGNVSLRFFAGQNAEAVMRGGDYLSIQYPQTRGLALQDVKTDGPLRVAAVATSLDKATNTVFWEGKVGWRLVGFSESKVEARLGDVLIVADKISFQAPPSDRTMLRSIRFEPIPPPQPLIKPGEFFSRIAIEGNERIPTDNILSLVQLKPGAPFDQEKFDASMMALKDSGLFSNLGIRVKGGDKGYELTVIVHEREQQAGGDALAELRARAAAADLKFADAARKYGEKHPDYQRALLEREEAAKRLRDELNRQPQTIPAGFDANDPVYLRGTVEKIDFADTTYTAYVRARGIAASPAAATRADDRLWKLSPINYWGERDRVSKDILKQAVDVTGYRSANKACGPDCEIYARTMIKCSVQATFAPGCAPEPGQSYLQQPPPPPLPLVPRPPVLTDDPMNKLRKQPPGYDGGDPIMLRGKVERIDFTDTAYTLFVRASSVSNWGGMAGEHADTTLFELNPTNFWGDRSAINSDLKDKPVWVYGLRGVDKDCKVVCKVFVADLKRVRPTALPAITVTPGFGSADVVVRYDASKPAMIQGVVQRLEFGDRMFDAWVQIPTLSGVPGALVQVRSDYRFPRADIEKQLAGKSVYVAGWRSKVSDDDVCGSPCGLYATEIRLASGDIVSPAGERLVTASVPSSAVSNVRQCFREYNAAPANASMRCTDDNSGPPIVDTQVYDRYARYDMDTPVTLDGRIVRVDASGWWVELIGFEPAATPGAQVGKLWYVEGFPGDKSADVGKRMSVRGYNAKDKSCNPTCRMSGFGGSWMR